MTPDDIRKLADCLPFAEQGHGLEETQATLRALADVVEASKRYIADFYAPTLKMLDTGPMREALARLEAIQ